MARAHLKHTVGVGSVVVALLAIGLGNACGGDDTDSGTEDKDAGTAPNDAGGSDAGRDSGTDAGASSDAGKGDAGGDAGVLPSIEPITNPGGNDPPSLTQTGLFAEGSGARLLLKGTDPNGDIASYSIEFFNGADPILYDSDANGTPDKSVIETKVSATPNEAGFYWQIDQTVELSEDGKTTTSPVATSVKVTVKDANGNVSEEKTIQKTTPTAINSGGTCDAYGFDKCSAANSVCASNTGTAFTCGALSTVRTAACQNAQLLAPTTAEPTATARGRIKLFSLWNPPVGCVSGDPKSRPDTLVKLRLATDVSKVVLSTKSDFTKFDTQLYLLQECGKDPVACVDSSCACADDIASPASLQTELTLNALKKGDYLIVIESNPSKEQTGIDYEISATITP